MSYEVSGELIGGLVGAVSAAIAAAAAWRRADRIANAKAESTIAAEHTDKAVHDGHNDEITSLRGRLDVLDASVVALNILVQEQGRTIARLEAKLIGIAAHFGNMFFCDSCRNNNLVFINAIEKALAEALSDMEKRKHD